MKTTYILLPLVVLAFAGCENTVDNPEWPEYKEQLVVTAFVRHNTDDSVFVHTNVRKTLPVWEKYEVTKCLVPDAQVVLTGGNGSHTIALTSQQSSSYDKTVILSPDNNKYTLRTDWHGLSAYSTVELPVEKTAALEAAFITQQYSDYPYIGIRFPRATDPGLSYRIEVEYKNDAAQEWTFYRSQRYVPDDYNWGFENNADGTIMFRFAVGIGTVKFHIRVRINVISKQYKEYVNSVWSYYSGDDFFDAPNKNPDFNVHGDGIGFFYAEVEGEWKEFTVSK